MLRPVQGEVNIRHGPREAESLFRAERYDRCLSLEFNEPKLKERAQGLLLSHKPTSARFVGSDRTPDRIPVFQIRILALHCVVDVFCRHGLSGRVHELN